MGTEEVRTAWTDTVPNRDIPGNRRPAPRRSSLDRRTGIVQPISFHGGGISFQTGIQLPDAESAIQEIMPLKRHAREGSGAY